MFRKYDNLTRAASAPRVEAVQVDQESLNFNKKKNIKKKKLFLENMTAQLEQRVLYMLKLSNSTRTLLILRKKKISKGKNIISSKQGNSTGAASDPRVEAVQVSWSSLSFLKSQ